MRPSDLLDVELACDLAPGEGCFGIRPGALMQAESWTACTASFIFANATDLFMETAAHCVKGAGNRVWFYNSNESAPGIDTSRPADGEVIFVPEEWDQANYNSEMAKWDFALVRLNATRYPDVNPRMCRWDGPHGIHNATGDSTDRAYFYGHGVGISSASPERVGVGPGWDGGPLFYVRSATYNRDSGGPWIDAEGRAIGHETATPPLADLRKGTDQGVHIQWLLNVTRERGFSLTLVDAGQDPVEVMAALHRQAPETAEDLPSPPRPDHRVPTLGVGVVVMLLLAISVSRRQ